MTMTLDDIPTKLNELDLRAPREVFDAIDSAIRERDELRAQRDSAREMHAKRDDEAQFWRASAERAEAELVELKARIAQAPLQVVESLPGAVGPPWPGDHWIEVRMADPCACVGQGLIGKRVRLVVEE